MLQPAVSAAFAFLFLLELFELLLPLPQQMNPGIPKVDAAHPTGYQASLFRLIFFLDALHSTSSIKLGDLSKPRTHWPWPANRFPALAAASLLASRSGSTPFRRCARGAGVLFAGARAGARVRWATSGQAVDQRSRRRPLRGQTTVATTNQPCWVVVRIKPLAHPCTGAQDAFLSFPICQASLKIKQTIYKWLVLKAM